MFLKFKSAFIELGHSAHRRLFGGEMSEGMVSFIKNLSYIGSSGLIAAGILFVVQVVAVRALGPEEYGKFALILSASNFMPYVMFMGLHASLTRYLAEVSDSATRRIIISTNVWGVGFFTFVSVLIFYFFREPIADLISVPLSLYLVAILFSVFSVGRLLAEALLKGLLQFKQQAILEIALSILVFIGFFALFFFGADRNYQLYVIPMLSGFLFYTLIVVFQNVHQFSFRFFDLGRLRKHLPYGLFSIVGSLSLFVIWSSDRFFLNKFLDVKSVGVYTIYYGASLIILSRVVSVFMKVFLPVVSGKKDKAGLELKLNRVMWVSALPLVAFNALIIYLLLLIYGKEYPVDFLLIILFSINAVLYTFINAKGVLLAAEGVRGMRYYSFVAFLMAVFIFILNLLFIPRYQLVGAVSATIVVSVVFLALISLFFKKPRRVDTRNHNW